MRAYIVSVIIDAPYPISSKHTITASTPAAAAGRAIREALGLKRDGKPVIHKRRIDEYRISIKPL